MKCGHLWGSWPELDRLTLPAAPYCLSVVLSFSLCLSVSLSLSLSLSLPPSLPLFPLFSLSLSLFGRTRLPEMLCFFFCHITLVTKLWCYLTHFVDHGIWSSGVFCHIPFTYFLSDMSHVLFVSFYRGFPTRMVYLYYISCLRYTILAGNPRILSPFSAVIFCFFSSRGAAHGQTWFGRLVLFIDI